MSTESNVKGGQTTSGTMDKDATSTKFSQLQREYRAMESNRKTYTDESLQLLRRQQASVEKLLRENEKLKAEIGLETKHVTKSVASAHQAQLAKLQDQLETYAKRMTSGHSKFETTTAQIHVMRQKVLHQKKHLGGVNASKDNQQMISKQIRILENRLDKALIKFNAALAQNKELRDTIDNFRRERVVFDNIYRKLEKELGDKKHQMASIIELSNVAYEQRDQAQMEVAAIGQANQVELDDYARKMNDMSDRIASSKASMLSSKSQTDIIKPDGIPQARVSQYIQSHVTEHSSNPQESHHFQPNEKQQRAQATIERVQSFEEAFTKIRLATGIEDIDALVKRFIQHEDQNFSLFNYVSEQTNEIEKLEETLAQYQEEERTYSDDLGDEMNQQVVRELETKLHSVEDMAEKYDLKCLGAQKNLNALKVGIQRLYTDLRCDQVMSENSLLTTTNNTTPGSSSIVLTETNMMQCLGIIEQQVNEILQQYAAVHASSGSSPEKLQVLPAANSSLNVCETTKATQATLSSAQVHLILGLGPATPMGQEQLQINPPKLEDYSSSDEDETEDQDMRPLTRNELKVRSMKGLEKNRTKEASSSLGYKFGDPQAHRK